MDDRYQVGQLTEELAFGNYFEAEDTLIQRQVQIFRYLTPQSENEEEWKEAFGSSSADLATVSQPGLPIIYTHGIDEEGPYTIRQLLDTVTLNSQLADNGPLSEYEAWELAHQMLEIHAAALPSNNFHGALDANHIGQITRPSGRKLYSITDYGLAEIHKRINNDDAYHGAPYLVSPEQAKGEAASEISQVYAIGQLVYHALCGGHPWIETALEEIIENQKSPQLLITDYNPNVPAAMAQWLAAMISFDPNDRFKSYEEAIQNLPAPIQSAPVPVQATSAIYTVPVSQVTTAQTVAAEETHITNAAEDFAAQQAALQAAKKNSGSAKVQFFKNPIVFGSAALLGILLLYIIFITGKGGEDSNDFAHSTISSDNDDLNNLPRDGLIAYIDFNDQQIKARNNPQIKLEALKSEPSFSRTGLSGKGLRIDKDHYFRLPLKGTSLANESSDFTISFWTRPNQSSDQDLVAMSDQPWSEGKTETLYSSQLWKPDQATIISKAWSMVTIVCSKSTEKLTIYIDGQPVGTSGNEEIGNIKKNPFIYIGCDSNEQFLHKSSVTLDNLAIWDRALSSFEIDNLFD